MGIFEQILMSPASVILSVLLVLYAIREGYELVKWWKNRAQDYHKSENEKEDFREQVTEIAATVKQHTETLERINKSLGGIDKRIDEAVKERKKEISELESKMEKSSDRLELERKDDIKATGRILLYQFYEKLKDKDEVTAGELEAFNAIADRCIHAGVNGVFKGKIIPFIQAKPVEGR